MTLQSPPSPTDREIVIDRLIDAPRETVFGVWSKPEHIDAWWGPRGFTNTTHSMDFRAGGEWRYDMHAPTGEVFANKNVYTEVTPPSRIAYYHGGAGDVLNDPHAAHVTVTFDDESEGRTRLVMRMVFGSAEQREYLAREFRAVEGGNQTIDRLQEYVTSQMAI
jgi:uncharacterized protein YndB with AHSA1/START domain